jgi:hypothetical protein
VAKKEQFKDLLSTTVTDKESLGTTQKQTLIDQYLPRVQEIRKQILRTAPITETKTEQVTETELEKITEPQTEYKREPEHESESDTGTKTEPEQQTVSEPAQNPLEGPTDTVSGEDLSSDSIPSLEDDEPTYTSPISNKIMRLTSKKGKVEDTHTRQTYLIRNSLLERFTKAAKNKHKGFKTEVVNLGIEMVLDMLEEQKKQQKK